MPNNPAKYEVLIKQYLRSILDISVPFNQNFRKFRSETEWNDSVQPEKFRKDRPTSRGGPLFRLDRSDRNGPFHLTIPTHSQSQYLAVRYFYVQHELTWRKMLSMKLLWIANSGSIGDTHTSTCSYNRSGAASQAKGMFWLFTALKYVKDDLFPERIWNVLFVMRKWCLDWERSAQNKTTL